MAAGSGEARHPLTRGERVWLMVLYWGLVAACVLFTAVGWRLVRAQELPLRNARTVPATVIRVDVIAHKDPQGHTLEQPIVMYAYEVDGVRYSTDRVTLREASRAGRWAKDIASRFHAGDTVTAYYDPATPGSAFLITERSWVIYAAFVVPLVLAILLCLLWPRVLGQATTG
jgi:uncharacterized membrane protein YhdT